jgi:hypothetical protein
MLDFLRSRQWIVARRLLLIAIILVLGIRQYGPNLVNLLRRPNPTRDIVLTRTEFRPELPGTKPGWIIGFRNNSDKFTYDQIQLEATYIDDQGKVLEKDKLVVKQKLPPGDEKLIGSADFKSRGAAKSGTLKVTGAEQVK